MVRDDGGAPWQFHCVELTDGSRQVAVGARVVFTPAPGLGGQLEARQLVVVSAEGETGA